MLMSPYIPKERNLEGGAKIQMEFESSISVPVDTESTVDSSEESKGSEIWVDLLGTV
jgi:hypothetical protein